MLKIAFYLLALSAACSLAGFAAFFFFSTNKSSPVSRARQDALKRGNKTERTTEAGQQTSATTAGPLEPLGPLERCPDVPPDLQGVVHVEFSTNRTLEEVRRRLGPLLQQGGRHRPADCVAQQKVAVIVPFRNRHGHLKHWLHFLHPILMRQQLDYGVYIINQDGDGVFNRAKLMNIGHVEALKDYDYDCFVFSDVDLVPLDDRNLYRCSDNPRHLSVAVDKLNFVLPYATIFGGVSAMSKEQFMRVNGFSNTFWGWGGEDDDLSQRLTYRGMSISRPDSHIGRYKMIQHGRDLHNNPNPQRVQKLSETAHNMDTDGLNSLNYTVREIRKDLLYTFITVDVQAPAG